MLYLFRNLTAKIIFFDDCIAMHICLALVDNQLKDDKKNSAFTS